MKYRPGEIRMTYDKLTMLIYLAWIAEEAHNRDVEHNPSFGFTEKGEHSFHRTGHTTELVDYLLSEMNHVYGAFDIVDVLKDGAQLLCQDFKGAGTLKMVYEFKTVPKDSM